MKGFETSFSNSGLSIFSEQSLDRFDGVLNTFKWWFLLLLRRNSKFPWYIRDSKSFALVSFKLFLHSTFSSQKFFFLFLLYPKISVFLLLFHLPFGELHFFRVSDSHFFLFFF